MSGLNKVMLIGRLGRDPEVRRTQSGNAITSFSLATSESWRDKNTGERRDKTEWHNIVIFNENIGKVAEQYLKKGSECYVAGKLRTREYEDRDGNKRKTTEIVLENFGGELVLIGGRGNRDSGDNADREERQAMYGEHRGDAERKPARRELDDDIPF